MRFCLDYFLAQGLRKNLLLSQSFEAKVFCRHSFRSWHTKVLFDKHSRSFRALMTYKISKFTGFCHRAIWRKIDRLEFLNSALLLRLLCSYFLHLFFCYSSTVIQSKIGFVTIGSRKAYFHVTWAAQITKRSIRHPLKNSDENPKEQILPFTFTFVFIWSVVIIYVRGRCDMFTT